MYIWHCILCYSLSNWFLALLETFCIFLPAVHITLWLIALHCAWPVTLPARLCPLNIHTSSIAVWLMLINNLSILVLNVLLCCLLQFSSQLLWCCFQSSVRYLCGIAVFQFFRIRTKYYSCFFTFLSTYCICAVTSVILLLLVWWFL